MKECDLCKSGQILYIEAFSLQIIGTPQISIREKGYHSRLHLS